MKKHSIPQLNNFFEFVLSECNSSQLFNNGIQIVPYIYGNQSLPSGKEIALYNSRITYNQNYTVVSLNFTISAV